MTYHTPRRSLALPALGALALIAGHLVVATPTAEAFLFRRVLWSETFGRYDYQRQLELRTRCAASAASAGVDYTEVRITPGPSSYAPSLFECIGVEDVTITNPPTVRDRPQTMNQGVPIRTIP